MAAAATRDGAGGVSTALERQRSTASTATATVAVDEVAPRRAVRRRRSSPMPARRRLGRGRRGAARRVGAGQRRRTSSTTTAANDGLVSTDGGDGGRRRPTNGVGRRRPAGAAAAASRPRPSASRSTARAATAAAGAAQGWPAGPRVRRATTWSWSSRGGLEPRRPAEPVEVSGYLDMRDEGYGFLRVKGYLPSRDDSYIPVKLARQYGLRKGDHVTGLSRPAGRNEKNPALLEVHTVNGADPEAARAVPGSRTSRRCSPTRSCASRIPTIRPT